MTRFEVTVPDEWATLPAGTSVAWGSGDTAPALCAVDVVAVESCGPAALRRAAEAGPHPGLERDTTDVALPAGPAVRSTAYRFAEELLTGEWRLPYAGEVRYAIALPGDRIGILHFETPSLHLFPGLAALFDTIARTARVA